MPLMNPKITAERDFIMKKILALIMVLTLVGCSAPGKEVNLSKTKFKKSLQKNSEVLEMMVDRWEYDFDGCAYELVIEKNQEFSLWCACGNPVGNSDLVEYFVYDEEEKLFYLYGPDRKFVETMKGELISENELKLDGNVFERVIPGKIDEEDLFDISKQEPSEKLDIIKGEWECIEEIDYCDSLTVLVGEDHKYTEICACGEHVHFEKYYIYDEEEEWLILYETDDKTEYGGTRAAIISEDEANFGGNLCRRKK